MAAECLGKHASREGLQHGCGLRENAPGEAECADFRPSLEAGNRSETKLF